MSQMLTEIQEQPRALEQTLTQELARAEELRKRFAAKPPRYVVLIAPRGGKKTQRRGRIVHRDLCNIVIDQPGYYRACGALFACHANIVATVEIRPLQSKEQLAVANTARIGTHAFEWPVIAMQHALHCLSRL